MPRTKESGSRIVLVGGGSVGWTPRIVRDLLAAPALVNSHIVLLDIDRKAAETMAHGQGGKGDMWLSYSPDLIHWGNSKLVAETRPKRWDGHKLGAGLAPLKTPEGWLLLYHGVYERCNGLVYRCGAMLLDLE